jgi:replicative DNA helicase
MSQLIESSNIAAQFDRLPPHSIEAEMCVLASMMLDKEQIGPIAQLLHDKEAFFQTDHQIVFERLVELYQQGKSIDPVILREELAKRNMLEEIGGTAYLAQIVNTVPSAAHGMHYAGIVREKSLLRQLIAAANDTLKDAYAPHEDAKIIVDRAEKRVFDIAQKEVSSTMQPIDAVLQEVWEMITGTGQRGIMTGFHDMDEMLNGMQRGEMIIVAARPSMGKTSFAMNMIEGVAADQQIPCAVFSLEMSKQQLAQRLLCSRGNIDSHKLRKGMLSNEDHQKLAMVVGELAKAPIFVDDAAGLTVLDLRAKCRRLKREHNIQAIMIDYLQLMEESTGDSRQQQISTISRGIKAVARELMVPVVCLSQLNRASEGRDGHRPRMSDLRESGAIEQDADVIMLLHREDYYHKGEADYVQTNVAEVIIEKQRNGPTGMVELIFDGKCTRFRNKAAVAVDAF